MSIYDYAKGSPVSLLTGTTPKLCGQTKIVLNVAYDNYDSIADNIWSAPTISAQASIAYKYLSLYIAQLQTVIENNNTLSEKINKLTEDVKTSTDCLNHIWENQDDKFSSDRSNASTYHSDIDSLIGPATGAKPGTLNYSADQRLIPLKNLFSICKRVKIIWERLSQDPDVTIDDKSAKVKTLTEGQSLTLQSFMYSLDVNNNVSAFNYYDGECNDIIATCNNAIKNIQEIEKKIYGDTSYLGKRENQTKISDDAATKAKADSEAADLATVYEGLYLGAKKSPISQYLIKVLDFLKNNNTVIEVPGELIAYEKTDDIPTRLKKSRGNLLFKIDRNQFKTFTSVTPQDISDISLWSGGSVDEDELKAFISGKVPAKQPPRTTPTITPEPTITVTQQPPTPIVTTPQPPTGYDSQEAYNIVDAADKIFAQLNDYLISQGKPQFAVDDYYALGDSDKGGKSVLWTVDTATKLKQHLQEKLDIAKKIIADTSLNIVDTTQSIITSANTIFQKLAAAGIMNQSDLDALTLKYKGTSWTNDSAKAFCAELQTKLDEAGLDFGDTEVSVGKNKFKVPMIVVAGGVAAVLLYFIVRTKR